MVESVTVKNISLQSSETAVLLSLELAIMK